jgi:hypothetical protein
MVRLPEILTDELLEMDILSSTPSKLRPAEGASTFTVVVTTQPVRL